MQIILSPSQLRRGLLAAILLLAACSSSPVYTLAPDPTPYMNDVPSEYYLYLPASYTPEREWPLFIGVHGFGGNGRDCLDMWQEYADPLGFVLLCPSLADKGGGWDQFVGEVMLKEIIRDVREECHVQQRVFLAGFSAGAEFVQGFGFDEPGMVSGVAVLSAGNYYEPSRDAKNVPFLVLIGDQDDPLGIRSAGSFTNLLKQAGYTVNLHLLPGIGHQVSQEARDLTIKFYQSIYPYGY